MSAAESPRLPPPELSPASPLFPHDPYTPEQRATILNFLGAVEGLELSPVLQKSLSSDPEIFAVKFLTARKWILEDALKMLKETVQFRLEKQLDTTGLFPATVPVRGYSIDELIAFQGCGERKPGELDVIHSHLKGAYAASWHKHDKHGRPVYIERTGHVKVKELVAKCKSLTPPGGDIAEPCRKSHLHSNEVGGVILRYCNEAAQREGKDKIVQVTVIMDCAGMGMGHLFGPAMEILKQNSAMDQKYYPEGLANLYVVNAPSMITIAWSIVKGWIEPRVQKKVIFVKPADTARVLLEAIDADCLPAYLGGTCSCEGECVPEVASSGDAEDGTTGDLPLTEEISIARGSSVVKEYAVLKGTAVSWEFAVNGAKYDINFRAVAGEGAPVADLQRQNKGSGVIDVTEDGKIIFTLDNSYSWVYAKTVLFRISFKAADS